MREADQFGQYLYRGHADAAWKLEPSLLRLLKQIGIKHREVAVGLEMQSTLCFQQCWSIPVDRPTYSSELVEWWALMQHYGGRTRCLDWSASLFVGLYFAVHDQFDRCGRFYVVDSRELEDPTIWMKDDPREIKDPAEAKAAWERYRETFRTGKPLKLHYCQADSKAMRLKAQSGWFTTCTDILKPHEQLLGKAEKSFIIPNDCKQIILRELLTRQISGSSLFSDGPERAGLSQKEYVCAVAPRARLVCSRTGKDMCDGCWRRQAH